MRKFILFKDTNEKFEMSPLLYMEFVSLGLWGLKEGYTLGGFQTGFLFQSINAFSTWIRHNNLYITADFENRERDSNGYYVNAVTVVEPGTRDYEFNPSGDEVTWVKLTDSVIGDKALTVIKPGPERSLLDSLA